MGISDNIEYQRVKGINGGSYSHNKLNKLGMPDMAGARYLDLGCNGGFYCGIAKTAGAEKVVGVDLDPEVIKMASQNYPDVEFLSGDWDRVFPEGTWDVVTILSAIHYAENPVFLVNKIYDALSPEGLLIIEGGVLDTDSRWSTDCLIPGWRKIGDRCRHLSMGYLHNHLLIDFEWKVYGNSEPRGGDQVPRYVVHAKKRNARGERVPFYTLNLLDYANGISMSADTVAPSQPATEYLKYLKPNQIVSPEELHRIFQTNTLLELFLIDLLFALEPSMNKPVRIVPVLDQSLLDTIASTLNSNGHQATIER